MVDGLAIGVCEGQPEDRTAGIAVFFRQCPAGRVEYANFAEAVTDGKPVTVVGKTKR